MSVAQSTKELAAPLPHNLDAERSILGAIILDNHALDTARAKLSVADFFLPQHRTIFSHMLSLANTNEAIDHITLMEHLAADLESAGGVGYISQLGDGQPRVTNVGHYAQIVKDKAALRSLIYSASAIQEQALAAADEPALILDRAKSAIAQVSQAYDAGDGWRSVFHTFDEFEAARPLSFSIDGFLQNNCATMFGGLSGHGKTFILLSIVKALLGGSGARLWKLFDVEETAERVIYLIPECSIEPFKHRLKMFGIYPYAAPDNERLLVRTLSKGATPRLSDSRILHAAKGAHVFLDTAVRFGTGDENDADDNRALANDIFALLAAGARSVVAAHHSPKPFAKENVMRLENVLRGSGDIGAMLGTAWGVKQLDAEQNIIHIENIKPRDFQPCGPFQIIGRPHIDEEGDFRLYKRPGQCGSLQDEQPDANKGGASEEARHERERRIEMAQAWLKTNASLTVEDLRNRYREAGIDLSRSAVKNYRREALAGA